MLLLATWNENNKLICYIIVFFCHHFSSKHSFIFPIFLVIHNETYETTEWISIELMLQLAYICTMETKSVSEWSDMSICDLLFQWASTIKIQLSVLVYYKADLIIILLKINLFLPWYSWKITELVFNNYHSLTLFSLHHYLNCTETVYTYLTTK